METRDMIPFLVDQFQKKGETPAGEDPEPAALDRLYDETAGMGGSEAAHLAITRFAEFCGQFLREHPPQTHVMLAEGFGVTLAGGYEVRIGPTAGDDAPDGGLEESAPHHVTVGKSIRGQGGVEPSSSIGVTGNQQDPYMRRP